MTNRRKTVQIVLATRPYVMITSLVATLAAGVGGCASSLERSEQASGFEHGLNASAQIPPSATKGRFDASYYTQQAQEFGAPDEWAEHAGSMTIAIEAQRALAEATRIRASADHAATLAEANQLLTEALSAFEAQSATARRVRESALASFAAGGKELAARRTAFEAEHEASLATAQAQLDEAMRRAEEMRQQAERQFALAQVDHDRLVAEAEKYATDTRATIEQIRAQAGSVVSHAQAQASSLETEAQALEAMAAAQWKSLDAQAQTTQHWAESRYAELLKEAAAVREQASAEVEDLTAQADAIAGWELDEKLAAETAAAQAQFESAEARVEALRNGSTGELAAAASAFTTKRQNLQSQIEIDGQKYEAELARIASDTRIAESRAMINRARGQELMHDARAQFIRLTAAGMEWQSHTDKVRNFEQAQVWADTIAHEGDAALLTSAAGFDTPEMRSAIETFITQLAEAKELEQGVDDALERAQQQAVMRRSEIEVWWTEARAASEAALDGITHAEMETVERMRQQFADAEEIESRAQAEFEQAQRSIESARIDAQSRFEELNRQAELASSEGQSHADEILAQAESVKAQGVEQAASLTRRSKALRAKADAQGQALHSQAEQILADAQASSAAFTSMAQQAQASLKPELDKRAGDADRLLTEAKLERDQAFQSAQTVEYMAESTHNETLAALKFAAQTFETDQDEQLARASSTRDEALSKAEQILAEATASYADFQADDATRRVQAEAVEAALLAFVDERHAVADAQDAAVFAEFSAKLATFAADADRSYADAYFKDFLTQADLSPEDLKRYVAAAESALGRLRQASSAHQPSIESATEAASGDHAASTSPIETLEVESMSANGVASVPTIDDE